MSDWGELVAEMELVVSASKDVSCIYGEELDLRELGKRQITRASRMEPVEDDFWFADMGQVNGLMLGPFGNRDEALVAEREWLVVQIVETTSNQRLPCTAPDASALLAAFKANRCRSGLAYR